MSSEGDPVVPNEDPITDMGTDVSTEQPVEEKKKRRGGIWIVLLSILLVAAGVTVGVVSLWPHAPAPNALVDLKGNVIVPEDPSATEPAFMQAADMVVDDGGKGFVVPAVNLNVPIGSINEVDGVMNPANFTSVFWIRNRGVSMDNASQGTVYMVTHAVAGGMAPGNMLQSKQHIALNPGDKMMVNNLTYDFVEAQVIPKTEIGNAAHSDLWANVPGRLVLVTCLVRPEGGIAIDNLVIIGQLET
ncbi:MAG: class F sortase [Propionibacteriaceae bacterium]|nr:class F sortase [Propionibacteriaceae bacterium]